MNFLFGTGGFSREIDWLTDDLFHKNGIDYRTSYFVERDDSNLIGETINSKEIISESDFFSKYMNEKINCILSIGSPILRQNLAKKITKKCSLVTFPNVIHPNIDFDIRAKMITFGKGGIFCANNVVTTNVKFGDFIILNLSCTIGHDTIIDDFTTISPGVNISGNVRIGQRVFWGTGANIVESVSVCDDAIIGAGATVISDIDEAGTYVGSPARRVR